VLCKHILDWIGLTVGYILELSIEIVTGSVSPFLFDFTSRVRTDKAINVILLCCTFELCQIIEIVILVLTVL